MIKLQALATAVLLTVTVILSTPTKAEVSKKSADINNLPLATDLPSTNYDPYPFGTVDGLVLRTDNGGANCIGKIQLDRDSKAICTPYTNMTPAIANISNDTIQ